MSALIDCPACTTAVSTAARSCPSCGHPIREALGRGTIMQRSDCSGAFAANDSMALLSMICGIVAIPVAFIPFEFSWVAVVLSLLAVIFAAVTFSRIYSGRASGSAMAVTGLVRGLLGLIVFVLALLGLLLASQQQT